MLKISHLSRHIIVNYIPEDVDAFFMCPLYFNVEKYSNEFETIGDYENFLKSVFDILNASTASVSGLVIREDLLKYVGYEPSEVYDIEYRKSHFGKIAEKKYLEKFYIFKK